MFKSLYRYLTNRKKTPTQGPLRAQFGEFNYHFGRYIRVMIVNRMLNSVMIIITFVLIMGNYFGDSFDVEDPDHIATISFTGVVSSQNKNGNARNFAQHFDRAIENEHAKAILIIANSPGGSPVQAEMLNSKIAEYIDSAPIEARKPVYVSVQEVCASACIYAFSGVDKIYVHKNSMVGSISVRMDGWGIERALAKLDIERKVLSPGKYKDLFDPYKNLTEAEKDIIMSNLLEPLHATFVESVIADRNDKLNQDNELLFTGMAFTGSEGVELGLADEMRSTLLIEEDLKDQYNVKEIKRYNAQAFSFKNLLSTSMEEALRSILVEQTSLTVTASQ